MRFMTAFGQVLAVLENPAQLKKEVEAGWFLMSM